jgi:inorganic pyrophosphatase
MVEQAKYCQEIPKSDVYLLKGSGMDFWRRAEFFLTENEIKIDRPRGSCHPRFPDIIYPLDYGYLKGTTGGDGNEIDVWKGSLVGNTLKGIICTLDSLKKDAEIKFMVDCTDEEIEVINRFYNDSEPMSGWVVKKN